MSGALPSSSAEMRFHTIYIIFAALKDFLESVSAHCSSNTHSTTQRWKPPGKEATFSIGSHGVLLVGLQSLVKRQWTRRSKDFWLTAKSPRTRRSADASLCSNTVTDNFPWIFKKCLQRGFCCCFFTSGRNPHNLAWVPVLYRENVHICVTSQP